MPFNVDKEKNKRNIALVLEKIKAETDTGLLEEYYSLFRKEVSMFNRSKVAAYLLMLCDQGKGFRYLSQGNFSKTDKPYRARTDNGEAQRYPLADEESKKLFFSAGRSRRVYPREILGLINMKTAIPKEDIGAIRILDNYSFVQVRDTVAEQIINALNGVIFRGRPLTVNYAKSRKDEAEQNPEEVSGSGDDSGDDCGDDYDDSADYDGDAGQDDENPTYESSLEDGQDTAEDEDIQPDSGDQNNPA